MRTVIQSQKDTTMWYGSEYRPVSQLEHIYKYHRDWDYFKRQLQKGSLYPVRTITKRRRLQNLHYMMGRGNHKLAENNIAMVQQLTQYDVIKGFAIILPATIAPKIKIKGRSIR